MLRPLEAGDADGFAGLVRLAFTGLVVDPLPSALRLSGDDVRAHLASGGGVIDPGRGGLLWAVRDGLLLSRLAVHPAHRRQGLARVLLAAAESHAKRCGLEVLRLSTRLALLDNRRLFASAGFAERDRHAHPGYAEATFVEFEKRV